LDQVVLRSSVSQSAVNPKSG